MAVTKKGESMNTHLITLNGEAVATFKPVGQSAREVKREALTTLRDKGCSALPEYRIWQFVGAVGWKHKKPTKRAIKGKKDAKFCLMRNDEHLFPVIQADSEESITKMSFDFLRRNKVPSRDWKNLRIMRRVNRFGVSTGVFWKSL